MHVKDTDPLIDLPVLTTPVSWEQVFRNPEDIRLFESAILPSFLKKCRWFGGKAKTISRLLVNKAIPVKVGEEHHYLLIMEVCYPGRLPDHYFLPVGFMQEPEELSLQSAICRAEIQRMSGVIMDSSYDARFREFLFASVQQNRRLSDGAGGFLKFRRNEADEPFAGSIDSRILKADQSNTAIIFGDLYFLKFYRKLEEEINPDLEIVRFLTERTDFRHAPHYAGSIQYRDDDGNAIVIGLLQNKIDNEGDAWVMTMNDITGYYDAVQALPRDFVFPPLLAQDAMDYDEAPEPVKRLIGRAFYDRIALLGQRTAEMHRALSSDTTDQAFMPEEMTYDDQLSLCASVGSLLTDSFDLLRNAMPAFDEGTKAAASEVLSLSSALLESLAEVSREPIAAQKIRIHGDYHLGQVLFTGNDFAIIDFEGEPGLSFRDRRLKKSPFKDVAGMMRSFHYAAYGKILLNEEYRDAGRERLRQAAEQWQHYVGRFFLGSYLEHAGIGRNLSKENRLLIRTFLLEKAIYELAYELNNRPGWVNVPLSGILHLAQA